MNTAHWTKLASGNTAANYRIIKLVCGSSRAPFNMSARHVEIPISECAKTAFEISEWHIQLLLYLCNVGT